MRIAKFNLIDCTSWNYQVITIIKRKLPIHRAQHALAFMYKNHFIRIGVFIKIVLHTLLRCRQYDVTIVIDQYRYPAFQKILCRLNVKPFEAAMFQHFFFGYSGSNTDLRFCFDDLCGWIVMIQQRIVIGKTFR